MLPKVIIFNSVSVDGAIKDFEVDLMLHYEILGKLRADALFVGSNTAKTGIEMFIKEVPPEKPSDYSKLKVDPDDARMLWVISDSKGLLQGLLHVHRSSGYAKDIIVLVSDHTPKTYLDYLKKRSYDFIVSGEDHVDYQLALEELNRHYGINSVVTDSGGVLASVLLEQGIVEEIQLLVSPQIVGKKSITLFRTLNQPIKLELLKVEKVSKDHVLLIYQVQKIR